MRTRLHIFVNAADIDPDRLRELLDDAEVQPEKITRPGTLGVYAAIIADDLLGAERLRDLLRRNGVESFLRKFRLEKSDKVQHLAEQRLRSILDFPNDVVECGHR